MTGYIHNMFSMVRLDKEPVELRCYKKGVRHWFRGLILQVNCSVNVSVSSFSSPCFLESNFVLQRIIQGDFNTYQLLSSLLKVLKLKLFG